MPPAGFRAPLLPTTVVQPPAAVVPEAVAKDAIIAWFRGEFAAANAIIDALCSHLAQMEGGGGGGCEYESLFAAVHRRRFNWIPILQMQKYFSIADVTLELQKVAARRAKEREAASAAPAAVAVDAGEASAEKVTVPAASAEEYGEISCENGGDDVADATDPMKEGSHDAPESEIIDTAAITLNLTDVTAAPPSLLDSVGTQMVGAFDNSPPVALTRIYYFSSPTHLTQTRSQEVHPLPECVGGFCSSPEDCEAHRAQIKMRKGFSAREPVKGHMVNVVRGLKLYEDMFSSTELSELNEFVNELRVAGQNGELSGETFVLYNQQLKGNKREMIQLGAPIFGHVEDNPTCNIEAIPAPLEGVINRLIQCHLISDNRRPNGCIINFFDEGEYSQPFLKPPHLDQPVSTLLLSESTMAFGRALVNNSDGNYRGSLMLPLKEGSLLVMRGNSADTARHAMCSSPNKRVSVTFFKVRAAQIENSLSAVPPFTRAMTLWKPGVPSAPNGNTGYETMPKWGVLRAPLVMLAPVRPIVLRPRKVPRAGTGVFFPWKVGSKKPIKQLPPRAQKARLLAGTALASPGKTHTPDEDLDGN
nr:RNA demethylase ALKBH10B-like [Ipomoea batatas]